MYILRKSAHVNITMKLWPLSTSLYVWSIESHDGIILEVMKGIEATDGKVDLNEVVVSPDSTPALQMYVNIIFS